MDKLLVWEPNLLPNSSSNSHGSPSSVMSGGQCLCRSSAIGLPSRPPKAVSTITSSTESLFLELVVDAGHSASSYFKHPASLFEAKYEFIHGPLCGPAVIPASTEGELHFPHYEALGFTEPPRSLTCIWEIRVNRERDVWLHFDKLKFATRDCQDGRLDVFLPSKPDRPFLTICGHNTSAKDIPPLTSFDLTPESTHGHVASPSVRIQFTGSTTPARAAFKIAWTELFHLPRNPDGTLMTSRLTEDGVAGSLQADTDCGYVCPGESGLCIPAGLVCNGVVNCPGAINGSLVGDEALELCAARAEQGQASWLVLGAGAGGGCLLAIACLVLLCRCCCCCCGKDEDDDDY